MCNLGWDNGTCSHRQRLRDRIQFDGAAVPVSWFVEQEKWVFLWRTGTMMVLRVVVSSCLHLLPKEKIFVVLSVTPWSTQDPSQALESVSEGGLHTFHEMV